MKAAILTLGSHQSQHNGKKRTFLNPIHTSTRCLNGLVLKDTALNDGQQAEDKR